LKANTTFFANPKFMTISECRFSAPGTKVKVKDEPWSRRADAIGQARALSEGKAVHFIYILWQVRELFRLSTIIQQYQCQPVANQS